MPQPARLPLGAPESVRSFVECRSDRLELDVTRLGWLAAGGFEPLVELQPGSTSTTAPLRITWDSAGFLTTDLRLTILAGRLSVDTSGLPSLIRGDVDRWIADFNRTLTEHSKELDSLRVEHDRITLTKRATPPHSSNAGGVGAVATPGSGSSPPVSSPAAAPPAPPHSTTRKIVAIVTAIALVLLGGLGVWAGRRSGGDESTRPAPAPADDQGANDDTPPPGDAADDAAPPDAVPVADAPQPTPTPSAILCGAPQAGASDFQIGSWDSIDGLMPCNQLPPDALFGCGAAMLPCPGAAPWLIRAGGVIGRSHDGSVPDALTGEVGPSQAEFLVEAVVPDGVDLDGASVRLTSECGGRELAGRSALLASGPTPLAHPLFSFGPCTVTGGALEVGDGTEIALSPTAFGDGGEFVIDGATVAPELEVGNGSVFDDVRFRFAPDWLDAALTTLGVLAAAPLDGRCVRLAEPGDIIATAGLLGSCRSAGAGWVLAAGFTNDPSIPERITPVAHGAGFVNPVGAADSAAVDFDGFDTSRPLFDQTIFPCGIGHVGVTVCPAERAGPVAAGSLVAVTVVFADRLPVDSPDRTTTFDFAPSGGPTWTVGGGASGWTIDAGPTATAALGP